MVVLCGRQVWIPDIIGIGIGWVSLSYCIRETRRLCVEITFSPSLHLCTEYVQGCVKHASVKSHVCMDVCLRASVQMENSRP